MSAISPPLEAKKCFSYSSEEGELRFKGPYGSPEDISSEAEEPIASKEKVNGTDGAPPNGGLVAWLQVVGAFFLFMNSWGLINTFGEFQTFYKRSLLSNVDNSSIAWIGSVRAFILLGSPIFYGPIFDLGHPRLLVAAGGVVLVFGIMMTSLCSTLWQLILAQGVCIGLGSGAFFLTAVATIPTYFTTKKSLAIGIAASGSSIGGIVYPIFFAKLEPRLGFSWTERCIGFIVLATSIVPCLTIKMRVAPEGRRAIFNQHILKEASFNLWSLAWFFGNMGLYIPYFFIEQYATNFTRLTQDAALYTLTAINAASIFGRVVPGLVADGLKDPLLVLMSCTGCSTVLVFCWIAIRTSEAGLFAFCILYGFFSGAFVSLSTPVTVTLAPSMQDVGTRLGMFNFIGSLGLLVGNPVAGAIIKSSWTGAQSFCGIACLLALGLCGFVWVCFVSRKRVRRGG